MKLLCQINPEWFPICNLLRSEQILYYFISKVKERLFLNTHTRKWKIIFSNKKVFQFVKRQIINQNSIKHEPMLRCFKSAERNYGICDFDQLVSNFTRWNQPIFKSEWQLSKQQTFVNHY